MDQTKRILTNKLKKNQRETKNDTNCAFRPMQLVNAPGIAKEETNNIGQYHKN